MTEIGLEQEVNSLRELSALTSPKLSTKERENLPGKEYAYILGLYLGDGYINLSNEKYAVYALRITQDAKYTSMIEEHRTALTTVFGNKTCVVKHGKNAKNIMIYSKKIPRLFPQIGKGLKHSRDVSLIDWQREIVNKFPDQFIRGLIQTDGCRYIAKYVSSDKNASQVRYSFTNTSVHIVEELMKVCSLLGLTPKVHKRPSLKQNGKPSGATRHIVVFNRRKDVEKLEKIVGCKS